MIKSGAFSECISLSDVYYGGSKAQWRNVYVGTDYNESFLEATVHYQAADIVGDISGDGMLNMLDVVGCYNAVSGSGTVTDEDLTIVDVNGDGKFNMLDILALYNQVSGKV